MRNTDTLIDASKEVSPETNVEKTKYMLLSLHQNAGQSHGRKGANRSLENVAELRYLGTTVTDPNLIQEEIEKKSNSGNACYRSVKKYLTSCEQSKNLKTRIQCCLWFGMNEKLDF
jgi:hypothetical protein